MTATDRRYGSPRWKKLRLRILARDYRRCWVPACPELATVCDHIEPVYPGMPSRLFFDERNLRASCRRHNTARGVAARLERETAGLDRPSSSRWDAIRATDYSRKR